jgi:hypothetical protein
MSFSHTLVRLNAYEGLCLTADDLVTEQLYHRRTLHRHSLFLHGYGIVQGLQVELEQRKRRYTAVIKSGYGITRAGQGVQLQADVVVPLEVPKQDGEYILWLFHVERADSESARPVFDTDETREARIIETCAPRLHAADEDFEDGVALARIRVRVGRMVQVQLPVPRAGRQSRAAESYLKPRVIEFIRLNKKALDALFRTTVLQEMSIGSFGFYSSLVSAEFILIEEGTTDRVLYRTAGTLISYAHDFYNPLPPTTDRIAQFTEFVRRVNAEIPAPDQSDETWLRWFESFERLLQPLQRLADELSGTADAMR